jgi:hypothetical protein
MHLYNPLWWLAVWLNALSPPKPTAKVYEFPSGRRVA